ncbi:unnamed protein product [Urochloa humidicola]
MATGGASPTTAHHGGCRSHCPQVFKSHLHNRSYAHGCFYWIMAPSGFPSYYVLVLDTRDMKFRDIDIPRLPRNNLNPQAIVDAGEGMLGLLTTSGVRVTSDDRPAICLFHRTRRDDDVAEEWQLHRTVPFPKNCNIDGKDYDNCCWYTRGAANDVYLLVVAISREFPTSARQYHTLDLKTLLLERLCVSNHSVLNHGHIYARFPPLLAPPCI